MGQTHFDVKEIIGIKLFLESPVTRFRYVDATEEKRTLFGLLRVRSASPAGFLDLGSYRNEIYTEKEVVDHGYKVYPDRVTNQVCRKARANVYLSHDYEVEKIFESDQEAKSWVADLKLASGKTFEIVLH